MVNLYIWTMYYYTICIRNTSSVLEKIKITTWHWYLPWSCASTWLIPRLQVSDRPVSEWTAKNLEKIAINPHWQKTDTYLLVKFTFQEIFAMKCEKCFGFMATDAFTTCKNIQTTGKKFTLSSGRWITSILSCSNKQK